MRIVTLTTQWLSPGSSTIGCHAECTRGPRTDACLPSSAGWPLSYVKSHLERRQAQPEAPRVCHTADPQLPALPPPPQPLKGQPLLALQLLTPPPSCSSPLSAESKLHRKDSFTPDKPPCKGESARHHGVGGSKRSKSHHQHQTRNSCTVVAAPPPKFLSPSPPLPQPPPVYPGFECPADAGLPGELTAAVLVCRA